MLQEGEMNIFFLLKVESLRTFKDIFMKMTSVLPVFGDSG